MTYSIDDIVGLIAAALSFGIILLLPGIALGQITNIFGFRKLRTAGIYGVALLLGCSVLPVVDSLLCRFLGLGAALTCNLVLAAYGLHVVWTKGWPRPERFALVAGAIWLAILTIVWIDIDRGDRLYPSLLMFDAVKHAATVRAIVESGTAPPFDPFFLRDDPAGYYYFFYVLSALAERPWAGLVDSRAAVGGQIFWTGVALVSLASLIFKKAKLQTERLSQPLLLAVMGAAGLQILIVVFIGLASNIWMGQINWWNDAVASWPSSLLWVPHHVACLIASWTAFLLLADVVERTGERRSRDRWSIVVAAISFASAAGLSIWVTAGAVVTAGAWVAVLASERRFAAVCTIAGAGLLGLAIALPDLVDMVSYRAQGSPPVALSVRPFVFVEGLFEPGFAQELARLVALPINYGIEFGVFLIGSYVFWRQRKWKVLHQGLAHQNEVARLVTVSAVAGLVLASFFQSTVLNNDLGWRVILFTQMAALLWTVAALGPVVASPHLPVWERARRAPSPIVAALVIGYAGVLYDLAGLRAFEPLGLSGKSDMRRDAQVDREVRTAYTRLAAGPNRHLIVQHNPDAQRATGYGLYGKSRVAVADGHNGRLFGAAEADVAQRLDQLIPVFSRALSTEEASQRLIRNHVAAVMVTANDAIWRDRSAWIFTLAPLYASEHVRVVPVPGASP